MGLTLKPEQDYFVVIHEQSDVSGVRGMSVYVNGEITEVIATCDPLPAKVVWTLLDMPKADQNENRIIRVAGRTPKQVRTFIDGEWAKYNACFEQATATA